MIKQKSICVSATGLKVNIQQNSSNRTVLDENGQLFRNDVVESNLNLEQENGKRIENDTNESCNAAKMPKLIRVEATGLKVNISNNCGNRMVINENGQIHRLTGNGITAQTESEIENMESDTRVLSDAVNGQNSSEPDLLSKIIKEPNIQKIASSTSTFKNNSDSVFKKPKPPGPLIKLPKYLSTKCVIKPMENLRKSALGIETIFPNVCFHFLQDECVFDELCIATHAIPQPSEIRERLATLKADKASQLFGVIIMRCKKLIEVCFRPFADYFASQRYQAGLIRMIQCCEDQRYRMTAYFEPLIKAFIQSGLTYSETIKTILSYHRSHSQTTLSIILNMALVEGVKWKDLSKSFQLLTYEPNYVFSAEIINHLLIINNRSNGVPEVLQTILDIFTHNMKLADRFEVNSIDQAEFVRFSEIYQSYKVVGSLQNNTQIFSNNN